MCNSKTKKRSVKAGEAIRRSSGGLGAGPVTGCEPADGLLRGPPGTVARRLVGPVGVGSVGRAGVPVAAWPAGRGADPRGCSTGRRPPARCRSAAGRPGEFRRSGLVAPGPAGAAVTERGRRVAFRCRSPLGSIRRRSLGGYRSGFVVRRRPARQVRSAGVRPPGPNSPARPGRVPRRGRARGRPRPSRVGVGGRRRAPTRPPRERRPAGPVRAPRGRARRARRRASPGERAPALRSPRPGGSHPWPRVHRWTSGRELIGGQLRAAQLLFRVRAAPRRASFSTHPDNDQCAPSPPPLSSAFLSSGDFFDPSRLDRRRRRP